MPTWEICVRLQKYLNYFSLLNQSVKRRFVLYRDQACHKKCLMSNGKSNSAYDWCTTWLPAQTSTRIDANINQLNKLCARYDSYNTTDL